MTEPLFTHFLAIRLGDAADPDQETAEPRIRFCLPAPGHSINTVPGAVLRLSYPDLGHFHHNNRLVSQSFKGTLGSNCFLYFRRHLQPLAKGQNGPKNVKYPLECLCLVTKFELDEIFDFVMRQLQIRWLLSPNSVPPFLLSLLKQGVELPQPSGHIAMSLRPVGDDHGKKENFLFHRPPLDHMGTPADVLFEYLSVDNVLTLISALFCEQRVILSSSSLTTVSQCIHAARSLLYPFRWQHLFASTLPGCMLHYACSPAPYLIGLLDDDLKTVVQLPLHPTLVVRLDQNILQSAGGEVESISLPGVGSKLRSRLGQIAPQDVLSDRLKKGLNTILGKSVDMDQILCSDAIYVSFMTFYVLTFGAWRRYMEATTSGQFVFNVLRFLDTARNASEDDFVFFERLCHTKMFRAFIQELVAHSQSSLSGETYEFCRLCSAVMRKDSLDISPSFNSVLDALKTEMYPNRSGRFAALALELTSSAPATIDRTAIIGTLAQATFSSLGLREIISVIFHRLADCQGRSYRHATLTFELLEALVNEGSDAVLTMLRDNISLLMQYCQYVHKEEDVQLTVRGYAEGLLKASVDLADQAKKRAPYYYYIADSISQFKVRANESISLTSPSAKQARESYDQICTRTGINLDNRSRYLSEFHSIARKKIVEAANETWVKYREKSLIRGRARIVPKFSKLHKKVSGSSSLAQDGWQDGSAQFEDILDLSSNLMLTQAPVDPSSTSDQLPAWDRSQLNSTSTTAPTSNDIFFNFFSQSATSSSNNGKNVQSQTPPSSKVVDPFEGLFN